MRQINKQAGFTLIELIMVIVILGVLSAFALPRFADLGGQARIATINGAGGAMKSAANIAHAQQLANGASGSTAVLLEGVSIAMANGYPTIAGIMVAAQITSADFDINTTSGVVSVKGTTAGTCSVTYVEATAATTTPVAAATSASVNAAVTSGC
jgi:MSHA pilin protein MshA